MTPPLLTWPLPPAGLWWRVVARARRFPQGGYFQEHVWSVGLTGSGKTRMVREHSDWSFQCFDLICQLSHLSLISLVSSLWPFFLLNNYPFLCSLIGHFLLFFNLIGQVVLVTKAKSRRYRTGPPAVSEVPLMWYGTTELKTSTAPVLRGWYVSHIQWGQGVESRPVWSLLDPDSRPCWLVLRPWNKMSTTLKVHEWHA